MKLEFSIYRYNPDADNAPRMQDYTLDVPAGRDMMLLDALIALKNKIPRCHSVVLAVKVFVAQMA